MYFKNSWHKTEQYLSYINMEHASFRSKWLSYMSFFRTMATFVRMTISTSSHRIYIVMDAS